MVLLNLLLFKVFIFFPHQRYSTNSRTSPIPESVPSVEAVPHKIGRLLAAGVDGVKLYFTLPPDTAQAIIKFVDNRVPITGHLGYTHSLDVIKAGIDGLEKARYFRLMDQKRWDEWREVFTEDVTGSITGCQAAAGVTN